MSDLLTVSSFVFILFCSITGYLWLFGIGTHERWETFEAFEAKEARKKKK